MILKAKQLVKVYGSKGNAASTQALKGIDLSIEEGEFIGIMGPSGSGKTTLLNLLGGIDHATSGAITIEGINMSDMTSDEMALFRRRRIGFIFQDFNLLDSLTIKENIVLPMILDRVDTKVIHKKAKEVMDFYKILETEHKYPCHISGGQKQRAAACRALINDPTIVLADEPTGNLDSKSSHSIMTTFKDMNEEGNHTICMVTHDPFAASFCKRIIFIKDGHIEMEIVRKADRQAFFDEILDCEALMAAGPAGGGRK